MKCSLKHLKSFSVNELIKPSLKSPNIAVEINRCSLF